MPELIEIDALEINTISMWAGISFDFDGFESISPSVAFLDRSPRCEGLIPRARMLREATRSLLTNLATDRWYLHFSYAPAGRTSPHVAKCREMSRNITRMIFGFQRQN